jgi:ribosomal protein S15P/S13E
VVEPMFELSSLKSHLDDLSEDNEFRRILKNSSSDSKKVTKYVKDSIVKKYSK